MVDYNGLLERLAVSAGDQECLYADAKAAIEDMQVRLAEAEDTNKALRVRLGSELERANERLVDLECELYSYADAPRERLEESRRMDELKLRVTQLEAELAEIKRAEREKQEPVAWLDRSTEERPGDTVWLPDDLQGMSTRGLVPLYAAPPVITQHEPVTTVEDRYNDDGKSCHITDDLPAGMPLYAAPPVAAPVRLTR